MENNEGGVCYTDHLYHSSFPSDEEVSDDDGLLQIGEDEEGFFCDGGEKGLGHTSEIGNDKCHLMDMETLDGTNVGGCVDLNGKDYSNLNMDDMKDVVFSSVCEAEKFYHLYSRVIGFSTRKDRKVRAYRSEFVIRREWVCSKQGKATINAKKQGLKEKGKTLIQAEKKKMKRNQCPRGKRYSRVGCMAGFGIRYCKERKKYFVSKFITNHNHDVAVSEEVQFLRSHRGVTDSVIAQVEALQKAQVHISRIYENFGSMLVFSHSQNHSWVINEKVSKFSCSIAPKFLISNADTDILLLSNGTSGVEWLYPMVSKPNSSNSLGEHYFVLVTSILDFYVLVLLFKRSDFFKCDLFRQAEEISPKPPKCFVCDKSLQFQIIYMHQHYSKKAPHEGLWNVILFVGINLLIESPYTVDTNAYHYR